jgi:hypothetical protein
MTNPINRINSVLKTKEDMQSFVLVAFILFVLFVKCYMVLANPEAANTGNQRNADIVKTEVSPKG